MRIEDRLTAAGERLRGDVDAPATPDDVQSALDSTTSSGPVGRWRARPVLLAAAAVVVLAATVGAFVAGDDDAERLVADEGEPAPTAEPEAPPTAPEPSADVTGEVIGGALGGETGAIAYLGVEGALIDQWTVSEATGAAPTIDFAQQAVLVFTVSADARCMDLLGVTLQDDAMRPHFEGPAPCRSSTAPGTFFVAVDRADLPATFDLVLDSDLLDGAGPYALTVDTSENFTSFTPPKPGSAGLPAPEGPDLERPEPGREITFDRIGDVSLGQTFGPSDFDTHVQGSSCGYWGPGQPSHDGDEPLNGLVSIEGDVGTVISVMVYENPRYRTASGIGVGTSLATLERIYGDDLVVDRADGWDSPTGELIASYVDVAAVRNGDRALTYYLHGDVVHTVKLSNADFWGDDEGCA